MRRHEEDILLFIAALVDPGEAALRRAREALDHDLDWDRLERSAILLQVSGGLIELFARMGVDSGGLSSKVRKASASEFATTVAMQSFFRRIAALLDGNNIEFIPLKGCDIRIAGGSRRLANPMEDVDILVRSVDLPRVRSVLEQNGFLFQGAHSGAHLNFASDEKNPRFLEIHWDLINRKNPVQRKLFHPDMERIWKECVVLCGRLHLSKEDLICYTIAHAIKEYFRKPRWAADVAYLLRHDLPGLDEGKARKAVEEWGVGPALGILAEILVSVTGDRTFGNAYRIGAKYPDSCGRLAAFRFLRFGEARRFRPLLYLACAGSFRERISLIAETGMQMATRGWNRKLTMAGRRCAL